jgi:pyrimidine-nucleoside phosphorylase
MQTRNEAAGLARKLIDTTRALGRDAMAYVTDMSRPLGEAAGNALEVREAVAVLKGEGPDDVRELTLELAAAMLRLSGATSRKREAEKAVAIALDSGAAWAKFVALVEAQGGDARSLERDGGLPRAPYVLDARAKRAGVVRAIDTRTLGECVVAMGGGRRAKEDNVDPRVGVMVRRQLGDRVTADEVLAHVHLASEDHAMAETVAACFTIGARAPEPPPLIIQRLD